MVHSNLICYAWCSNIDRASAGKELARCSVERRGICAVTTLQASQPCQEAQRRSRAEQMECLCVECCVLNQLYDVSTHMQLSVFQTRTHMHTIKMPHTETRHSPSWLTLHTHAHAYTHTHMRKTHSLLACTQMQILIR